MKKPLTTPLINVAAHACDSSGYSSHLIIGWWIESRFHVLSIPSTWMHVNSGKKALDMISDHGITIHNKAGLLRTISLVKTGAINTGGSL